MQADIRDTDAYQEAAALYESLRQPGTGQISDAAQPNVSPDGRYAVYAGAVVDTLEGPPSTRLCLTDLQTGDTRVLTYGRGMDQSPKFSPDGQCVAFLSDRHRAGDFQLYLLDRRREAVRPTPRVDGWVEYLHWSPDGSQVLLGVAGHGADISGGQGAIASKQLDSKDRCAWMPRVETSAETFRWRRAWVYDVTAARVRQVSKPDTNVWEAVWCGKDTLAAVVSPGPAEGLWYSARLNLIDVDSGHEKEIYAPQDQLGWPAASPSGRYLVIVEATCSDRWIVAGELRLIDCTTGTVTHIDTRGIDITHTEWRSERTLLVAGHRGLASVVGALNVASHTFRQVWESYEISAGVRYISVAGRGDCTDCVLVGESFLRAPELAVIHQGEYKQVKSFDLRHGEDIEAATALEPLAWDAPDGLRIEGWLLRPRTPGPHPLVMQIHGGPVWIWHPTWLGRAYAFTLMMLKRGYAFFFPNPRGSAGRGRDFVRPVVGDMGGADTYDYLSGIDHLVREGIADPQRLGVTGVSYGGFMTSWLVTQDRRFAAAVAVAPVTNYVTEHLISNLPQFVSSFLADTYTNPGGKYFQRSPIMHAHRAQTPTLNICGALDRCTPPEEAMQFHHALLENGVESVLVTYPQEGHGIRQWPAMIDYSARVVSWFEKHVSTARYGSRR